MTIYSLHTNYRLKSLKCNDPFLPDSVRSDLASMAALPYCGRNDAVNFSYSGGRFVPGTDILTYPYPRAIPIGAPSYRKLYAHFPLPDKVAIPPDGHSSQLGALTRSPQHLLSRVY
jgi:hypothetical protein